MNRQPPTPNEPWAVRQQPSTSSLDDILVNDARRRHPTVVWWWGKRRGEEQAGAYCYLCDDFITTWDVRWPMTETAKQAVMEHRTKHISESYDKPSATERAQGGAVPHE